MPAYLDIETSYDGALTVVGLWRPHGGLSQWVSPDIDSAELLETLSGAQALYTYNGHRFDLPVIHRRLGLNLKRLFASRDLMYDCWRRGLYGGLKAVERQLGIPPAPCPTSTGGTPCACGPPTWIGARKRPWSCCCATIERTSKTSICLGPTCPLELGRAISTSRT